MAKNWINVFTKLKTGKKNIPVAKQIALIGNQDAFSTYPSKGLTPSKLASILRDADQGDVYRQMELFEEMLEKDGMLFSLFQSRRLRVTRKNYNIVPASDSQYNVDIAKAVDQQIKNIRGWKNVVNDILDCVPKAYSASEIFWNPSKNNFGIEKIRCIHPKKFRFGKTTDINSDPEELRFVIDPINIDYYRGLIPNLDVSNAATDGISISEDPRIRRRFIIAYCKARSGNPSRASLLRTCTYLYLFKNYDIKWWIQFAEILLGIRIGKYDTNQEGQKELLEQALRGLSTDASAVIPKESEIEFKEMAGKATSHLVYGDIKNWCNEEMSLVVLGHSGASVSTPGKLGNEDAAKESIQSLIESDASVVDEAITDDIIVPFVDYNFGPQEEYPYYQTDVSKSLDLNSEADIDIKLQQMGFPLTQNYVKEKYGRPLPNPNDKKDVVLIPTPQTPGLNTTIPAKDVIDGKKKLLTRQ